MITLQQAKELRPGQVIYHTTNKNADGTPQRWRVNGKVKLWKRSPGKIQIPVKFGLYIYGYITEKDLTLVSLTESEV